jgi:RimJ/RimL family protein N-acetyltransferase
LAGEGHLSGGEGCPREELEAGPLTLRRHRPSDTAAILEAVNESLAHLAPWMSWAQAPATENSIGTFLAGAVADFEDGSNFGYAITERDATGAEVIVGGCGLHPRIGPAGIEIG